MLLVLYHSVSSVDVNSVIYLLALVACFEAFFDTY